jgi:multidrug efflux pump subunit AcrA (membrane-fusion protein)
VFVFLSIVAWSVARRPPGVDGDLVFFGDVRQGEFLYEVTAQGSLYAPEIRSVTNQSEGVVEVIHVLAGHSVAADDVLMVLSSPNLQQELADAEAELESALADEALRKANSDDERLTLESSLADAVDSFEEASLKANSSQVLAESDAITELELRGDVNRAAQAERRMEIAQAKVDRYPMKRDAEDAQAQAKLDQSRRKLQRLQERVRDLEVRAGFAGVVQEVSVEEGQRLSNGTEVARVVNPDNLIARISVSERDAPLVELGQPVRLEMGRESITGEIMRIDPAVKDRLVTVDVALVGEPTRQLRPDLTVTGRIQIERVADTLVVGKPPQLRDDQERVELFRLDDEGKRAERVSVEIGRVSAREVEILSGLDAGDQIILADMTEWLEEPVVRIR